MKNTDTIISTAVSVSALVLVCFIMWVMTSIPVTLTF